MNGFRPAPIEITHLEMAIVEAVHDKYLLCLCPGYVPPKEQTLLRFASLRPILQLTCPNASLDFTTLPEAADQNRTTLVEAKRQEDHIRITIRQTITDVAAATLSKTIVKVSAFNDRISFLFNRTQWCPRHVTYDREDGKLTTTFIVALPIVEPWVRVPKQEPICIQG